MEKDKGRTIILLNSKNWVKYKNLVSGVVDLMFQVKEFTTIQYMLLGYRNFY